MNSADTIAERHRIFDGQDLADYMLVALPVYALQAAVLYVEKRRLLPTEEYVLKSIRVGLTAEREIGAFLGLAPSYCEYLIGKLIEDDYLGRTESSLLFLRPKGTTALGEDGEERLQERSLSVLWDPIQQTLIAHRIEVLSSRSVKAEGRPKVVPRETKMPAPLEISAIDLQRMRGLSPSDSEPSVYALRCVELRRPLLRYRSAVLLVYGGNRATVPVVRVALDGQVDDVYSSEFLRRAAPEQLGIDRGFYRRVGTQVVEQRIRKVGVASLGASTYGDLLSRRSTLRLSIETLEKQEDADEVTVGKLLQRKEELGQIETALERLPHRSVQAYEVAQFLGVAASSVRTSLLITSTLPTPTKCDALILMLLDKAAQRRVLVNLYFVGRPDPDFLISKDERWKPLRRLSELANAYENFRVSFLRESSRSIFECQADDSRLLVANEPSLGNRPGAPLVRQFSGYVLSGQGAVRSYAEEFLQPDNLVVSEHFRYQSRTGGRARSSDVQSSQRRPKKR